MHFENIEHLQEYWIELENDFFKEIDKRIATAGLDVSVHEEKINEIKTDAKSELLSGRCRAEQIYNENDYQGMSTYTFMFLFKRTKEKAMEQVQEKVSLIKKSSKM